MLKRMTSRERIFAAIRHETIDHIPLGQLFHSTILNTPKNQQWHDQFERAQIMLELGLDPVIDIWLPAPSPPANIPVKTWNEIDSTGTNPLLCASYETPAGILTQKVRRTADWFHPTHYRFLPAWDGRAHRDDDQYDRIDLMDDFFTRRYVEPLIKEIHDLDAFAYLLKPPSGGARDLWLQHAKQVKRYAKKLDLVTLARRISIGDWFMWVCLIENFCIQMIEEPAFIERFYDIVNQYNLDVLDMVLEIEPDIVQYRGWYDTPDYWGRDRYNTILMPRINQLGQKIHQAGSLFCVLLTEGYTLYRDILADMDVDVYLGLDPLAMRKSEDLSELIPASPGTF